MNEDEENYKGWTNYETREVALWIINDINTRDYFLDIADESSSNTNLASLLRQDMAENNPLEGESGLYANLLNSALSKINFHEIAEDLRDGLN